MNYHTDAKYTKNKFDYSSNLNVIIEGPPVGIFTVGDTRNLQLRKRILGKRNETTNVLKTFQMKHNSLFTLVNQDEKPCIRKMILTIHNMNMVILF